MKRTTTRALAASVALVAAGGTVAGAAVFHLPVLGFGPTNAGATATASPVASVTKKVTPRRVVKIRVVDQIVHHRAATRFTAGAERVAGTPTAPSAAPQAGFASPTTPPAVEPPAPPGAVGGEDHESADAHDDADHEAHDGQEDHGGGDEADSGGNVPSGDGIQAGR